MCAGNRSIMRSPPRLICATSLAVRFALRPCRLSRTRSSCVGAGRTGQDTYLLRTRTPDSGRIACTSGSATVGTPTVAAVRTHLRRASTTLLAATLRLTVAFGATHPCGVALPQRAPHSFAPPLTALALQRQALRLLRWRPALAHGARRHADLRCMRRAARGQPGPPPPAWTHGCREGRAHAELGDVGYILTCRGQGGLVRPYTGSVTSNSQKVKGVLLSSTHKGYTLG